MNPADTLSIIQIMARIGIDKKIDCIRAIRTEIPHFYGLKEALDAFNETEPIVYALTRSDARFEERVQQEVNRRMLIERFGNINYALVHLEVKIHEVNVNLDFEARKYMGVVYDIIQDYQPDGIVIKLFNKDDKLIVMFTQNDLEYKPFMDYASGDHQVPF